MTNTDFLGKHGLPAFKAVVEDRNDPLMLGRARVRIIGWHSPDKQEMPTESLPWALSLAPLDHGKNPYAPKEGEWVFGYFLDQDKQQPLIVGVIHGIPEDAPNPDVGFNDPRSFAEVQQAPLPPNYKSKAATFISSILDDIIGKFSDPNKLPGENTAFGELLKDFDPKNYKFDVNGDGKYDAKDALALIDPNLDGIIDTFTGLVEYIEEQLTPTGYPLPGELNEPTTSRLARNENIEKTIVQKKKASVIAAETATHISTGIATDTGAETEGFGEPETPYAAKYPYNHTYESESGHATEIDDTPGAERLHQYHRSGSFTEFHPDGTIVSKSVMDKYDIALNDNNNYAKKNYNISADELLTAIGKIINIQSREALNIDSGTNTNQAVGEDYIRQVGGNEFIIVEGDKTELVKGSYVLMVKGDLKIKVDGNVLLEALGIDMNALNICSTAEASNRLQGLTISLQGEVLADSLKAHSAASIGDGPLPPLPCAVLVDSPEEDDIPEVVTPKPGFILDAPGVGYLYKPISDSDGNLVTLSKEVASHALYEAVPTGELETVTIQYLHEDNTITSWQVVRPVHKKGKLLERGIFKAIANGDRAHYRWSKPGAAYPKQMIWAVGDSTEWLILDSAIRHD